MAIDVLVPNAGQTSGEATILRWLKKPGDSVKVGEALLEVETDKATMEVEATAAGVLQGVRYETGAVVPVLTAVAVIVEAGERPNPPARPSGVPKREGGEVLSPPRFGEGLGEGLSRVPARKNGGGAKSETRDLLAIMHAHRPGRGLASPLARAMAANAGLELSAVTGSGPHGRIMKRDIEAISVRPSQPTTEPGSRWIPFSATRRTIAERMAASWREAPQVTLTTEADAESLARLRAQFQIDLPDAGDLSYTDLFIKIAAAALREQPQLNARVEDGGTRLFDAIHIGLAVEAERGLVVPVIREADRKGVAQIARERRDLAERARGGKLRPDELSGGTFTLTNLGAYEIDAFTPIVNPPEGAVLGVGRIMKKPVVRDDELRPGMTVVLSLTFDHRLVDGGPAARFLQRIKTLVEKPHLLIA